MGRRRRRILGLNSGTSADGVDAVVCEVSGRGAGMKVRLLGHLHRAYRPMLRQRLLAAMAPAGTQTEELCLLHREIGLAFGEAARALLRRMGLRRIDLVGSHGQTICHLPPGSAVARGGPSATLQIGDAATIAQELGAPVVSDFRSADIAAGGQGAPLVPWTDWVLFHDPRRTRLVQNIGGIANLTYLPAGRGPDHVVAFDTGPGMMVIDALVRHFSRDRKSFDAGGRMAATGRIDAKLALEMTPHKELIRIPPRSFGREEFGEAYVEQLLKKNARRRLRPADWIATATDATAATIWLSCILHLPFKRHGPRVDEIILCGGGARNATLVNMLKRYLSLDDRLAGARVCDISEYGISDAAKESVSFAMLAAARVDGVPANLRRVTGASRRVLLGQVYEPGAVR